MSSDFQSGVKAGTSVGITFVAIFMGFGITASLAGTPNLAAVLMTVIVFAGPAQFAMIEVGAQTGLLLPVISVGVLVNLRFLVMSMALNPIFESVPRRVLLFWAQFISASSFLVTFFESRKDRGTDPFEFFKGLVFVSYSAAVAGTAIGVWFGHGLPNLLGFGATLFLPIYFSLLISSDVRKRSELIAAGLGFFLTPLVEIVLPGWGIFLVALAVGLLVVRVAE